MTVQFDINNGELKKYNGKGVNVIIPDGVTKIGDYAFCNGINLSSVTIPDSVTKIGRSAFAKCSSLTSVTIPDSVEVIGTEVFADCTSLVSVAIPNSVKCIGPIAFARCTNLVSVAIPDGVQSIGHETFEECTSLVSVTIPDSVNMIMQDAFANCTSLTSITIPNSVTEIEKRAFSGCANLTSFIVPHGMKTIEDRTFADCTGLTSVSIADSVKRIDYGAFINCTSLHSVTIPDGVEEIGKKAFCGCTDLSSITMPGSVKQIGKWAFEYCTSLGSVTIPDGVERICEGAFDYCESLTSIVIPNSVTMIDSAFFDVSVTFVCTEDSYAHRYCIEKHYPFVFDYQFEAFHGLLPQGAERLSSPFLADEEQPFIFISYSHKDRDAVLKIIKELYESGWKIWYDEGLTIGDSYDETLESHVRDCAAFLLFVTENSLDSMYVKENEIPWAIRYKKPIIKCLLDNGVDYEINSDVVTETVASPDIEPALMKVSGLTKGERREAKGISVIVNPADRDEVSGDGFAYCLYAEENSSTVKAILLEAENSGCTLYNAAENGEDADRLRDSACLIVFLDKAFLSDEHLTKTLVKAFRSGRDIAVCLLEDIGDDELPEELTALHKMQWLNFVHGITGDMNTKLARHLQKRGCRNAAALPGFEYEETDEGIVIKKYTGKDISPRIESEYGGIPVVGIAAGAFLNCYHIKSITVPDSVRKLGIVPKERLGDYRIKGTFEGCVGLTSIKLPKHLTTLGPSAFRGCIALSSIEIPDSVTSFECYAFDGCAALTSIHIPNGEKIIESYTFASCTSLTSITIPDSVTAIKSNAFAGCKNLTSIHIPDGVQSIGYETFKECTSLVSVTIPVSVKSIGCEAFKDCSSLVSVTIPKGVTEIGKSTFQNCTALISVNLPDNLNRIGDNAFAGCTALTSFDLPDKLMQIGSSAFAECASLSNIRLPKKLTEIKEKTFYHCSALTSVIIPEKATIIGYAAFWRCTNLTSVTMSKNIEKIESGWEYHAFSDSPKITVTCLPGTRAWQYCRYNEIPVEAMSPEEYRTCYPGFFDRLFGKNK